SQTEVRMSAKSKIGVSCLVSILIGQTLFACIFPFACKAIDLDSMLENGIKSQLKSAAERMNGDNPFSAKEQAPIKAGPKVQRLEDLIPHQDLPYGYPPMIPLQGITINGLGPKATASLGADYFVVRNNTNTVRMSDLYRENRLAGKANFVTMDCVTHPYLAFTNRLYAETIRRHLLPLTKSVLFAMIKVATTDYKQADDAEVRADIEANIAFLSLAMKLLDTSYVIPAIGRVPQLVQADYDSVVFAKAGHS